MYFLTEFLTEILLGAFVVGDLLIHWHQSTERKKLQEELKLTRTEMLEVAKVVADLAGIPRTGGIPVEAADGLPS